MGNKRISFTEGEILAGAFEMMTEQFGDWKTWFNYVRMQLSEEDLEKLVSAAHSELETLGEEATGFSAGYITPNAPAYETMGRFIPREFLEFIVTEKRV